MNLGESERILRETFQQARRARPSVILLDELETLVGTRGDAFNAQSTDVTRERILSTLLTELDGVETVEGVVVVAATNRPDLIDPALLRPGRFDDKVYVPPPDATARTEIFKVHSRSFHLGDDVDFEILASQTTYYSGADLANVCHEAAMVALRDYVDRQEMVPDKTSNPLLQVRMYHFQKALTMRSASLSKELIDQFDAFCF